MNRIRRLSLGTVAILCLGCAEECPLEPPPVTKLPAMSVMENPIAAISDGFRWKDTIIFGPVEYVIDIPRSVLTDIRPDDMQLVYEAPDGCGSDAFIWRQDVHGWFTVSRRMYPGYCPDVISRYSWLLSVLDPRPVQAFIDSQGAVRLKGDRLGRPVIRVVRYHDNYEFLTINQSAPSATIASDGRTIWVCFRPWNGVDRVRGDSVLVTDLAGVRLRCFLLADRHLDAMAWSDRDLWVVDGSQPMVFSRMDSEGNLTPAFTLPRHHDALMTAMTWADGHLWIVQAPAPRLLGINLQQSQDSGYAVLDREISLPPRLGYSSGIASDGEHLYIAAYDLYKLRLTGEIIDSLPLPVRVGGLAWDGDSMWMLHMGPREAITYALLLSRFTLP
ncbi:MAG: hypothetical protein AB1792_02260 [Candidatus Zixiibacteriota bacterium]